MDRCIIMCRSLTYAQRTQRLLESRNITARITKVPQGVTPEGCSYGVKVGCGDRSRALSLMSEAGINAGRIYVIDSRGRVVEAER